VPIRLKVTSVNTSEGVDLAATPKLDEGKIWRSVQGPISCLANGDIDGISIASDAAYSFDLETIRVVPQASDTGCTGAFKPDE